jgi:hypothetical protein
MGKNVVLLGTFRETHWELVRDMRNLLRARGRYWKRHWEQKNLRKWEPHVSETECGWVHGQDQIRVRVSGPEEDCF